MAAAAAVGVAAGKSCARNTGAYAYLRKQFNTSIGKFEGVEEALANIGGMAYMMEAGRQLTLSALDSGEKPSIITAILKCYNTEHMRQVINHSMDIHGGRGICMGPSNYLARAYQSIPVGITVEGANILSRNLMIFGQGAIRCHPFVLKEMALASREDKEQALKEFDGLLLKYIGFAVSNAASTLVLNLGFGHFEHAPGDRISQGYFRALNRQAAAFAMLADFSMMLLGGELKRRERLSARLGDVLSNLYLASAALKRYHDLDSPAYMEPLFRWAMEESLGQSERALDELLSNFPNKVFGCLLRVIVFPFGRRHKGPSDKLGAEVAAVIGRAKGDPALEELLAGCYRPQSADDAVGALQHASDLLDAAQPLHKKLHTALKSGQVKPAAGEHAIDAALEAGVLQAVEAQSLRDAEAARRKVIDVDDFDKEELTQAAGKVR